MSRKVIELKYIGFGPFKDYWDYSRSYKNAAEDLVRLSDQPGFVCLESVAFALVFLYRHSLELMLKEFINILSQYNEVQVKTTHALDKLWNIAKPLINKHHDKFQIEQDNLPSRMDDIDKAVEYFRKIDPYSIEFRYPTNSEGDQTLEAVHEIDIDEISEMVKGAGIALGGMATDIETYFNNAKEMGY